MSIRRLLLICATVSACAPRPIVERVYDGHVVRGRFIAPQAYSAFLHGVAADAEGDARGAVAAYAEAGRIDPSAPEIWTRMGDVLCRINPRDPRADANFARAFAKDAFYIRAWTAKAKCSLARGDLDAARASAQRAVELDPSADGANALLAGTESSERWASTRALLVALTLTAQDSLVAWDALATYAKVSGDLTLWARALVQLSRVAPAKREEIAQAAEDLAGVGAIWLARVVAAAAADADESPMHGDHPLALRLAVDEAFTRGDSVTVGRRAARVRLPLDEVAGRGLLRGNRSLALDFATTTAKGDPTAMGARLVLAASGAADVLGTGRDAGGTEQVASAAAFIAFGGALSRTTSVDAARAVLSLLRHVPLVAGDDIVVRPAVGLVSRGILRIDVLPADGLVELATRRGGVVDEILALPAAHSLDLRHEYLGLALTRPDGERARQLRTRLARNGADPFVAAASALMAAAAGRGPGVAAAQQLLARDAGDPLLAAVTLRIARSTGDRELSRRASAALSALGEPVPESAE